MKPSATPQPGIMLHRSNERHIAADYQGDVLLWDIDKTYLDTRFSSWRGLLSIPFELAVDKRTIPGASALLRALRRGPGPESAIVPLYFVSGSPQQLRRVVERRMILDGVDFDGITFKDQWGLLRAGRLPEIRAQLGYKLMALLRYRLELPAAARWLCFGDDVEQDAQIFLLFGQVCAGLRGGALARRLRALMLPEWNIEALVSTAQQLVGHIDPVERIFIHMERGQTLQASERRIVLTRSYVQSALMLLHLQRITPEAVATVARDMRLRGVAETTLAAHLQDAAVRLHVPPALLAFATM